MIILLYLSMFFCSVLSSGVFCASQASSGSPRVHFSKPRQVPQENIFRHELWLRDLLRRVAAEKDRTRFPGGVIGTESRFQKDPKIKPRKIHGKANFGAGPVPAKVEDPKKITRQKIRDFTKVCGAFSRICEMRAKDLKTPEIVVSGSSELE